MKLFICIGKLKKLPIKIIGECIPNSWVCDYAHDCARGEDEIGCEGHHKSTDSVCKEFQCLSDGKCIPFSSRCDNKKDCSDGSDEIDCEVLIVFFNLVISFSTLVFNNHVKNFSSLKMKQIVKKMLIKNVVKMNFLVIEEDAYQCLLDVIRNKIATTLVTS